MVILIDHYDSFANMIEDYISQLGYEVLIIKTDELSVSKIKHYQPSHIILGPGPGHPQNPLLSICLGHQVIAEYFGAKVIHASKIMHGKQSHITHNDNLLFNKISHNLIVTRYHSLLVDPKRLPTCLEVIAECNENNELEIMGFAHKQYAIWGIQFHPEAALTEHGLKLLNNFLNYETP